MRRECSIGLLGRQRELGWNPVDPESPISTSIEIRRISAEEVRALRDLRLRALKDAPEAFGSTLAEMLAQPDTFWHDRAARTSAGGEQCLFIALERGRWVGMAGGTFDAEQPGVAQVISMWVDPSVRRRGVGQGLLAAVTDWSIRHGANQMQLWVTASNSPAIALYRRLGFEATGSTQAHPSISWLTEMEMAKPVTHK
jgi:GNAT superfamily N-acetyltransferase